MSWAHYDDDDDDDYVPYIGLEGEMFMWKKGRHEAYIG